MQIPGQTFRLGTLNIGPEVSYKFKLDDKSILEPFAGVKAIWDFAKTPDPTLYGSAANNSDIRVRLEGGISYKTEKGISIRALAATEGVGSSNFKSLQGKIEFAVPLN